MAKAYLYACRDDGGLNENRYGLLYFWREASGMQRFLQSSGFATLVRDFGWSIIESWLALEGQSCISHLAEARFITRKRLTISPHSNLTKLLEASGFSAWDVIRLQGLAVNVSQLRPSGEQEVYRIGYLARGAAASDLQL